jgi:hypothetical protein
VRPARRAFGAAAVAAALLVPGCTDDGADPTPTGTDTATPTTGPTGDDGITSEPAPTDTGSPPGDGTATDAPTSAPPPDAAAAVALDLPDGFTPQDARDRGSLRWDGPASDDGTAASVLGDVSCLRGEEVDAYVAALRSEQLRGEDYVAEGEVAGADVAGAVDAAVWSGRLNIPEGQSLALVFSREVFALAEDGTAAHVRFQARDRDFDPAVANAVVDSLEVTGVCGG